MGLDVYVKNFARYDIDHFGDENDSFVAVCSGAPWTSLRRGVHPNGHTLFNSIQLRRLVEELEALPAEAKTVGVGRVLNAAQLAIRNSGYLLFVGD
ncbi:hypothetical protein ACFYN0_34625 [Streptomyces sp. NPDC006704]|uniref:hypothetical protein n=1 Tax=Streptomyces sp. NPDC006704 TaxID=3364760 RepID=UPI00368AE9D0